MASVGDVASVVQLVDFGYRVLVGVADALRDGLDPPDILQYKRKRIPSLVERLLLIQNAFHPGDSRLECDIVQSCYSKIESLNKDLIAIQILASDTAFHRGKKALISSWKQASIEKALSGIEKDVATLLSYHDISRASPRQAQLSDRLTVERSPPRSQVHDYENDVPPGNSLDETAVIDSIPHVPEANFKFQRFDGCMEGTRAAILRQLLTWVKDPDAPTLQFLSGMAGTGKSAIALTVSCSLEADRVLGGTFFCSRNGSEDVRDVRLILPTLVWDLARTVPSFASALVRNLTSVDITRLTSLTLLEQFDNLAQKQIWTSLAYNEYTLAFVIDALDECDDKDAVEQFLTLLSTYASSIHVKLFITSRPEPYIVDNLPTLPPFYADLRLHEVDDDVIHADIQLYLETKLGRLRQSRKNLQDVGDPWPPSNMLSTLIHLSHNLFIYAFTAYQYIADRKADPIQRLARLTGTVSAAGKPMNEPIDKLYETIMWSAFAGIEEEEADDVSITLGAILCLRHPLSANALGQYLGIGSRRVVTALASLHSVIQVPKKDSQAGISAFHASFSDYLTDNSRCGSQQWFVDVQSVHSALARQCLAIMERILVFNIAGADSSHLRTDQPGFANKLSPHLIYSCRFWADHLVRASPHQELLQAARQFLLEKFLFWLEVLSVVGRIDDTPSILMKAKKYFPNGDDMSTYINDANAFVMAFRKPIGFSSPHIYLSALPFTNSTSRIGKAFRGRFPNTLVAGDDFSNTETYPLLCIERHTGAVNSVAFSPHGKWIATSSEDQTVGLWNAETGEAVLKPLAGHRSSVTSAVFSPDSKRIVSGSEDNTIRVWETDRWGPALKVLEGHLQGVEAVAYSPDSKWIASASSDRSVRLWDAETGEVVSAPWEGHTEPVTSVAFSPDSKRVASGSYDCTIRLWQVGRNEVMLSSVDCDQGAVRAIAFSPDGSIVVSAGSDRTIRAWAADTMAAAPLRLTGHAYPVSTVAFSRDGTKIVSGSYDLTVRQWDAGTGDKVSKSITAHSDWVKAVAFSPDGGRIVSASYDTTVRVWDSENADELSNPIDVHASAVSAVAVSPDGKRIASGSHDWTIRLWNAQTGAALSKPLTGHTYAVNDVAFSPDGKLLVSGSNDVRLWNAETGAAVSRPMAENGPSFTVSSVAFSPGNSRIASGHDDAKIRIWDPATGQAASKPFEGHKYRINTVAYSADGKRIASGSNDRSVILWDVETGGVLFKRLIGHMDWISRVAFSPDGKHVASSSWDCTVRIWDAVTGDAASHSPIQHSDPVYGLAYSPDSCRLVACSGDTVYLWEADSREAVLRPLIGHTGSVMSVSFTPDGKRILSGSRDCTIRVWDATSSGLKGTQYTTAQSHSRDLDVLTLGGIHIENGWVKGPSGELLFWIPPHLRKGLWWPRTLAILGANTIKLDMSLFVHGESWTRCILPS